MTGLCDIQWNVPSRGPLCPGESAATAHGESRVAIDAGPFSCRCVDWHAMKLTIEEATQNDVAEILALRLAVGARMQERYGDDRWAPPIHEGSVLRFFKGPRTRKSDGETLIKILVGKSRGEIVALTRMQTKKPWAFDLKYFTPGAKAVYLGDVEVSPKCQGQGLGMQLMAAVVDHARAWPVVRSGRAPTMVPRALVRSMPSAAFGKWDA